MLDEPLGHELWWVVAAVRAGLMPGVEHLAARDERGNARDRAMQALVRDVADLAATREAEAWRRVSDRRQAFSVLLAPVAVALALVLLASWGVHSS